MLTGRLDPDDAPPGYAQVAEVLAAASSPPDASELAGESSVVAVFAAAARSHPCAPLGRRRPRRRPRGVVRRLHLKTAMTGAALGVLAVSSVAAATGELPASAQQVAHTVFGHAGVPAPGAAAKGRAHAISSTSQTTRAAVEASATTLERPAQNTTTTHNHAEVALLNLCKAWSAWQNQQSGQYGSGSGGHDGGGWDSRSGGGSSGGGSSGSDSWDGKRLDTDGLVTLAKAAGGIRRISDYCHRLLERAAQSSSSSGSSGDSSYSHQQQSTSNPPPNTASGSSPNTSTTLGTNSNTASRSPDFAQMP